MNRIERIKDKIIGMTDPEDQMMEIMSALNGTVTPVPDPGGYYTFVYNAKTPNIEYDQHPLIACTGVYQWGFVGINMHWRQSRAYTWAELAGQLYIVDIDEFDDLKNINYANFMTK